MKDAFNRMTMDSHISVVRRWSPLLSERHEYRRRPIRVVQLVEAEEKGVYIVEWVYLDEIPMVGGEASP